MIKNNIPLSDYDKHVDNPYVFGSDTPVDITLTDTYNGRLFKTMSQISISKSTKKNFNEIKKEIDNYVSSYNNIFNVYHESPNVTFLSFPSNNKLDKCTVLYTMLLDTVNPQENSLDISYNNLKFKQLNLSEFDIIFIDEHPTGEHTVSINNNTPQNI